MNETECANLIESVKWTEPGSLISLAILEFINVLVIVGNCLVIAAVFCSTKLRSVTNFFIVNLAVADLLVGLAVLPFSATWEVFKVWIFGDVWCRIWLAVDVWMCTASILNLCAISLDRYVAVTRPVTYPSIMSTKRAKSLIAGIWVLSFVICFPPLVKWNEQRSEDVESSTQTYTWGNNTLLYTTQSTLLTSTSSSQSSLSSSSPSSLLQSTETTITETTIPILLTSTIPPSQPPCPWKCELTNDRGYVLYSALGSFYIPMFVMLFFYWRIYRAAVRTTRAINQGFKTTKGIGNRFEEQRLTLRIHRGRGSTTVNELGQTSNGSTQSTTTTIGTPSPERLSRYSTTGRKHEKIKISVSYPSNENIHELSSLNSTHHSPHNVLYAVHYTNGKDSTTQSQIFRRGSSTKDCSSSTSYLQVGKCGNGGRKSAGSIMETVVDSNQKNFNNSGGVGSNNSISCGGASGSGITPQPNKKMGKRNIKAQVKRFRMETKAAKTLAIIVGLFIICWLPFFTMYVIRAFCVNCINDFLFSIMFWLGYCNSAVNPMIYALFSKDFRFAFKRIICKCFCSKQSISQKTSRRGSDMSQIRIGRCRTPSISPSAAAHSLGDESEHNCAGDNISESR